jgi:hypothetical protein
MLQLFKMNIRRSLGISFLVLGCVAQSTDAQVVQIPTIGTFSVNTSVLAPDSGGVYAGGVGRSVSGSQSRGMGLPSRGIGGQASGVAASVRSTVIDLNELDTMIRSQAVNNPIPPVIDGQERSADRFQAKKKSGTAPIAEYEYIMALSGHGDRSETDAIEDTRYYLGLAATAKQKGHWSAVELYYKLAWQNLPEKRKEAALQSLWEAKNKSDDATDTKGKSSGTPKGKPTRN